MRKLILIRQLASYEPQVCCVFEQPEGEKPTTETNNRMSEQAEDWIGDFRVKFPELVTAKFYKRFID